MAVTINLWGNEKTFHEADAELVGTFETVVFKSHVEASAKLNTIPVESYGLGGQWLGKDLSEHDGDLWFAALARQGYKVAYLYVANRPVQAVA